ncbi:ISKra4 family transposase [Streptomyces sp. NBC_01136]|uniref:ISKra4 family transposase n=1 Tax=Streptomyces sp. NBC_01136 TaxID=2903754 RepID=UPI003867815B
MEAGLSGFAASAGLVRALIGDLADPAADALTHHQLEDMISTRGLEVMRQMLQDHLDLRSIREPQRKEVVDAENVPHRRVEPGHERLLTTVFGTVTVTRIAYRALGCANLHPLDADLNLPTGRASHGIRKQAAVEAVRGSFDDARAAIARRCGVGIGKANLEQLVVAAAADIDAYYRRTAPAAADAKVPLALSFDGKGIVMRPKDLREQTRKMAEAKQDAGGNAMKTRLAAGEKNGRKRMAVLGAVWDSPAAPRTVDDVITDPDAEPDPHTERADGPKARNKWLTGSVADTIADVVSAAFDQAEDRDPDYERDWVVLVDGAEPQIAQIQAEVLVRGVDIHIVCDLIHVLEYLWKAAWCFHDKAGPDIEAFVARHARTILAGSSERCVADLRHAAKTAALPDDKLATVEKTCTYLENKRPWLRYDTALAKGWPIATGIIEGACRHLVKDRLDITGARWSLKGAEAVLKLRALITNGDFEAYFAWHLRREHQRIHQARYQEELTLAA